MEQIQCPNCGGYKIKDYKGCTREIGLHLLFMVFTLGLWIIAWIIIGIVEAVIYGRGSLLHQYTCELCGYKREWREGTPLPQINVQPDLIAKGMHKLKEEERRRRGG